MHSQDTLCLREEYLLVLIFSISNLSDKAYNLKIIAICTLLYNYTLLLIFKIVIRAINIAKTILPRIKY